DWSVTGVQTCALPICQDLETLSAAVVKHGADAGIAHDGDADRCLAVDAAGQVIDGDQILAVLALGLKARNRLAGDTVVATVMSNLGFRLAMAEAGITVVETAVGDRYVLQAMRAGSYVLARRPHPPPPLPCPPPRPPPVPACSLPCTCSPPGPARE